MKKLISILALSLFVSSAQAEQVNGAVPTLVGLEGSGSQVYVGMANNSPGCINGGMYFLAGTIAERKAVLATALAAKLSGKTLRLDYTIRASDRLCILYGLYVE
jgi:hypothetical protein